MGGLEAVAFTGGIGENSAACAPPAAMAWSFWESGWIRSGTSLAPATASYRPKVEVAVLALRTNEELVVARRAYRLMSN